MTENNFITRYYVGRKEKNKMLGLDDLFKYTLFNHSVEDYFYTNFFEQHFIKEEDLTIVAQKEKEYLNKDSFFKVTEISQEKDILYGQIVFSKFDEILTSLVEEKDNRTIGSNSKFIPQRRFFFMLKFLKVREIERKKMTIGILLLHKRGPHSIKNAFAKLFSRENISVDSLIFKDELKELEKANIRDIKILTRKVVSDCPRDDEVLDFGIKTSNIEEVNNNIIVKMKKNVNKISNIVKQIQESNFVLDADNETIEVTLDTKYGERKLVYTGGERIERIPSIILKKEDVYTNDEIDWKKMRSEFNKEMSNCITQIDNILWHS